jgi:hypothetical protein
MQGIQHINPARHDLVDPLLQHLYDYWDEKWRGRAMPSRADIDPLEMTFILGYVSLVDVLYAPFASASVCTAQNWRADSATT